MREIIKCYHCHEVIEANPRYRGEQQYCGKSECQRARKNLWQHNRMHNDKDYKQKQTDYIKHWRKKKPFYKYMKEYRETHPEYEKSNRQKQKQRNDNRKQRAQESAATENNTKIVKMDTLSVSSIKANTYEMTSLQQDSTGKIVKMDTFLVQLKQIQGLSSFKSRF